MYLRYILCLLSFLSVNCGAQRQQAQRVVTYAELEVREIDLNTPLSLGYHLYRIYCIEEICSHIKLGCPATLINNGIEAVFFKWFTIPRFYVDEFYPAGGSSLVLAWLISRISRTCISFPPSTSTNSHPSTFHPSLPYIIFLISFLLSFHLSQPGTVNFSITTPSLM
jgi:hypothetical protein